MGRGNEVWPQFPQLSAAFELPLVWISAMVGHRIEDDLKITFAAGLDVRKYEGLACTQKTLLLSPSLRSGANSSPAVPKRLFVFWDDRRAYRSHARLSP
jgi:hypothetical protein